MKLLGLITLIVITSCARQTVVMVGMQPSQKESNTDSVFISYDYSVKNGAVTFTIHNTTNRPLYWDRKKSVLFINNESFDYWDANAAVVSLSSNKQYLQNSTTLTNTTVLNKERIVFMAPRSKLTFTVGQLPVISPVQSWTDSTAKGASIRYSILDPDNSPVILRNYLTFSYTEDFKQEFPIDASWHANKVSLYRRKDFVRVNNDGVTSYPFLEGQAYYYTVAVY